MFNRILDDGDNMVNIEEIPQALFDKIVESIPPNLKTMIREHECHNPDCMIKKLQRRMKKQGEYVDFSNVFNFGKANDDKGN